MLPSTPAVNHVFVDFENVQAIDLEVIGQKSVSFTLLLGARQTKLEVGLVEKLLEHAASVQLVRLSSSGKNALDFAVAYYLGRAAAGDPGGYFHIVSRDTGFDPLIAHLKSRHIHAHRHDDFSSLTFSGHHKQERVGRVPVAAAILAPAAEVAPGAKEAPVRVRPQAPDDLLERTLTLLRKQAASRPKYRKSLLNKLRQLCGKDASEAQAEELFERLRKAGWISVGEKEAMVYQL